MKPPRRTWNRRLATTKDGSPTLEVVEWGVAYHSIHGALTESEHVFIARGLERWWSENEETTERMRVLEVGFGTGLNAALAWQWAERQGVALDYVGIEPHPLEPHEVDAWAASGLSEDLAWRLRALHEQAGGADGSRLMGFLRKSCTAPCKRGRGKARLTCAFLTHLHPRNSPSCGRLKFLSACCRA